MDKPSLSQSKPFRGLVFTALFTLIGAPATQAQNASKIKLKQCLDGKPPVRSNYFPRIGIGVNYSPHYPCYASDGTIAPCVDSNGNPIPGDMQDAKNAEMESSVRLDLLQLKKAGFQTIARTAIQPRSGST
ncbi:MAG: hypothetical protein ACRD59_01550 [Candidatus Acidiferrales bacterium]